MPSETRNDLQQTTHSQSSKFIGSDIVVPSLVESADNSIQQIFIPAENGVLPYEGIFTAFEQAFFNYLVQDEKSFTDTIESLGQQSRVGSQPDFLNLSFEDLFNIPVTEGSSDAASVNDAGAAGAVNSIAEALAISATGDTATVDSLEPVMSLPRDVYISLDHTPTTMTQSITPVSSPAPDVAPVASNDTYAIAEHDVTLNIGTANSILSNDSHVGGGRLIVVDVNGQSFSDGQAIPIGQYGGLLTMHSDGTFVFDPSDKYEWVRYDSSVTETFTYRIADAHGLLSDPATVSITITPDDPGPSYSGAPHADTIEEDHVLVGTGLLNGVQSGEPLGEAGTFLATVATTEFSKDGAVVKINSDGTYTYDPTQVNAFENLQIGNSTLDTFNYQVIDNHGKAITLSANITVTVDDSGFLAGTPFSMAMDEDDPPATITNAQLLGAIKLDDIGDSFSKIVGVGDGLGHFLTNGISANGAAVTLNPDGSVTYDPSGVSAFEAIQKSGNIVDTLTYEVMDNHGKLVVQTVDITVSAADSGLAAGTPISITTDEDTSSIVSKAALIGAIQLDDSGDSISQIVGVKNGSGNFVTTGVSADGATVTLNGNGTITYNPNGVASFETIQYGNTGSDSFTYQVKDNHGNLVSQTVNVTITIPNDPPVALAINGSALSEASLSSGTSPNASALNSSGNLLSSGDKYSSDSSDGPALSGGISALSFNSVSNANGVTAGVSSFATTISAGQGFAAGDINHAAIQATDSLGNILTIDVVNGDYVYTLASAFSDITAGKAAVESFNYTLVNNHGQTSTNTLSISIADDAPKANAIVGTTLSEASLSTGSSPNPAALFSTGDLTSHGDTFGADGAAVKGISALSFNGATNASGVSAGTSSAAYTITGSDGFAGGDAGHAAIKATDSIGNTLIIDEVTGDYVYTLNHSFTNVTSGVAVAESFNYTLKDSDGSTKTNTITVNINDDGPVAISQVIAPVQAALPKYNVLFILDTSKSMSDIVSGSLSKLQIAVDAIAGTNGLLPSYNQVASNLNFQFITFNSSDTTSSVYNTSSATALSSGQAYLNSLVAKGNTDYIDTLHTAESLMASDSVSLPGYINVVYFMSDGQPNPASTAPTASDYAVWQNYLNTYHFTSYAFDIDAVGSQTPAEIAAMNQLSTTTSLPYFDAVNGAFTNVSSFLLNSVPSDSISGNILTADKSGADSPAKIYEIDLTFANNAAATSYVSAHPGLGATVSGSAVLIPVAASGNTTIATVDGGTLVIAANGTYTYTSPSNNFTGTDSLTYKIVDSDGTTASANIDFTSQIHANFILAPSLTEASLPAGTVPTPSALHVSGNLFTSGDSYGPSGSAVKGISALAFSSTSNTSGVAAGVSSQAYTVGAGDGFSAGDVGKSAIKATDSLGNSIIIVESNGDFVYTLAHTFNNTTPGTPVTETFLYTLTNANSDTATNAINISIADDAPLANAIVNGTALNEANLSAGSSPDSSLLITSGNLFTSGDKYGADGSAVQGISALTLDTFTNTTGVTASISSKAYTILNTDGFSAGDVGHSAIMATDSLGNVIIIDETNGDYVYKLVSAFTNTIPGTNVTESFSYSLQSSDGSTTSNDITVSIKDDAPVANAIIGSALTEASLPTGSAPDPFALHSTGNLIANGDLYGADGAAATGVSALAFNAATNTSGVSAGTSSVATFIPLGIGLDGDALLGHAAIQATDSLGNTIYIDETNGDYSYVLNSPFVNTVPGSPVNESFTYSLKDSDGSVVSNTISVSVADDNIPPIVLDFSGTGIQLTSAQNSHVSVDFAGTGTFTQIGWITGNEGILAYDPTGSGKVTNVSQIEFTSYKPGAQTDLQGLAAFDSNHNSQLDAGDLSFNSFGVLLSNGKFVTLAELGVTSISLSSDNQSQVINGNVVHGMTTFTTSDGQTHIAADTSLAIGSQTSTPVIGTHDIFPTAGQLDFSKLGEAPVEHSLSVTAAAHFMLGSEGAHVPAAVNAAPESNHYAYTPSSEAEHLAKLIETHAHVDSHK